MNNDSMREKNRVGITIRGIYFIIFPVFPDTKISGANAAIDVAIANVTGLAISIAPVGAWVAIRQEISFSSLILGAAVIFWLVGFDILYSCMDVEFDRNSGLKSIPQKFGVQNALRIAFASHGIMVVFLLGLLLFVGQLGVLYSTGVVMVAILLFYEHSLVRPDDLSKINIAFFNMNGIISIGLMLFVIIDCVWI